MKRFVAVGIAVGLIYCSMIVTAQELPAPTEPVMPTISQQIIDEEIAQAASMKVDDTLPALSAILIEQTTGQVLFAKNEHEKLPPASVTKVMTLLLAMEAIEEGRLTLDTMAVCSENAAGMGGSQIWLEPGEEMSVDDLLKATAIASANDAAVMLGEAVAGSESGFVELMNLRAAELGMNDTTFRNASGLDEQGHVTSAHDIAIMSAELMKYPLILEYSTVWMDDLRGGETQLVNTNSLVRTYEGATGLKTGTTSGAGSCLAATAERDGFSLVAVVMGCATSSERFASARALLDYGFGGFTPYTPTPPTQELTSIEVVRGVEREIVPKFGEIPTIIIQRADADKITQTLTLSESVEAPVESGQILGRVSIEIEGKQVGEYPVVAPMEVPRMTFWRALELLWEHLTFMGGIGV